MIIEKKFHNVKCDHCGRLLDEETWWDETDAVPAILGDCGWIECEGGRHYCGECWEYDDDDNIVTKDGRKWEDYDHKEIRQHRMNYLDLSEDMTLTQFRMELERGKALYHSMVGWLYKGMLGDDLADGKEWLDELIEQRRDTAEYYCYFTFVSHGIFRLAYNDAQERIYNRHYR